VHPVSALLRPAFLASVAAHGVVFVAAVVFVKASVPERQVATAAWVAFAPSPIESMSEPSSPGEEPPVLPEEPEDLAEALPLLSALEAVPEDPVEVLEEPDAGSLLPAVPAPRAPAADGKVPSRRKPSSEAPAPSSVEVRDAAPRGERAAVLAPPRPLTSNRAPVYPQVARARGLQGVVQLRVTIEPDGSVASAAIETSSGHVSLDRAAEDAVHGWRFAPALVDGVPARTTVRIPVTFRLS
jgi:protein TonB